MDNPVLVEVLRGAAVESRHRGSVVVADAEGRVVLALGDVGQAVYPRSAVKALQALALIESGAADRFGLTDAELAVACASHTGSAAHVAAVTSMLAKAGLAEDALECGAHPPADAEAAAALARGGAPARPVHNNCSGKHAGFLCVACATGAPPRGYVRPEHPVQRAVTAAIEDVTGVRFEESACGVDGCSIPTWRTPLVALARGFARLGTGASLAPARAAAAARLRAAVARHPEMVGGAGRFDTVVMRQLGARVFCKAGAEGVHCAALPAQGLGVALKIDDGAGRAAEVALGAVLRRCLPLSGVDRAALAGVLQPAIVNWNGLRTGEIRAARAFGPWPD